jgi:hypothetical protein
MSTLAEIEEAVERLSAPEQALLFERLKKRVTGEKKAPDGEAMKRRMKELSALRKSMAAGRGRVSLQEILDEIRAD